MWYILILFVVVFELAASIVIPYFPDLSLRIPEKPEAVEEQTFWDRLFDTEHMWGVTVLPLPEDEQEGTYYGYPEISPDTDLDLLEAGMNPFETFLGIMGFQIVGAEILGIVFYLMDFIIIICVIKLIRGS